MFAYDEETIIVAECKACEKKTRRSLQKDTCELGSLQGPISSCLPFESTLGSIFDQKIIWLFVTRNVDWSEPDKLRAKEANIKIITERELFYYKEIAKRIGHAARFQFDAEFLARTKVGALSYGRRVCDPNSLGSYRVFTFFGPATKILPIRHLSIIGTCVTL